MQKRKRRLSESELTELRSMMESAPQNHKPSVRYLARYFGVNQPSILKSLGGWKGIQRDIHEPKKHTPAFIDPGVQSPATIEEFTTDTSAIMGGKSG